MCIFEKSGVWHLVPPRTSDALVVPKVRSETQSILSCCSPTYMLSFFRIALNCNREFCVTFSGCHVSGNGWSTRLDYLSVKRIWGFFSQACKSCSEGRAYVLSHCPESFGPCQFFPHILFHQATEMFLSVLWKRDSTGVFLFCHVSGGMQDLNYSKAAFRSLYTPTQEKTCLFFLLVLFSNLKVID